MKDEKKKTNKASKAEKNVKYDLYSLIDAILGKVDQDEEYGEVNHQEYETVLRRYMEKAKENKIIDAADLLNDLNAIFQLEDKDAEKVFKFLMDSGYSIEDAADDNSEDIEDIDPTKLEEEEDEEDEEEIQIEDPNTMVDSMPSDSVKAYLHEIV